MSHPSDWARWLALSFLPRMGPVSLQRVLDQVGDPEVLFEAPGASLRALLPVEAATALLGYRDQPETSPLGRQVQRCLAQLARHGDYLVTRADPDYPRMLAHTPGAPLVLFARGRRDLLNEPQLAVVGARSASASGRELAHAFSIALVQSGLTVTSGLALGIDGAAHRGALEAGGQTIAVLGTGLDEIYPSSHETLGRQVAAEGLLVTEMPYGTQPFPGNFPRRNRIIAGLSLGVLVMEAGLKSGSLGTARQALDFGREVFAVPGSVHHPLSKGCHQLIRDGAKLVETVDDILSELPTFPRLQPMKDFGRLRTGDGESIFPLSDDEMAILAALGGDTRDADALVMQTGLPIERLLETLLMLELQGQVEAVPGGYRRIRPAAYPVS